MAAEDGCRVGLVQVSKLPFAIIHLSRRIQETHPSKIKTGSFSQINMAGQLGFEPRQTILETVMLPLHQ